MIMPFIVILPGIAALALTKMGSGYALPPKGDSYDYDQALTTLMAQFYPSGLLGVGLTALMASFMSGMAGNVTAFNTVFTYDIYHGYLRPHESDRHYLTVGRISTVVGIGLSIATAYLAAQFNNIMDFLQLVFGFVNAPLFATFLLGMFWKPPPPAMEPSSASSPAPAPPRSHSVYRLRRAKAVVSPYYIFFRPKWPRTSGSPSSPGPPACWSPLPSAWPPRPNQSPNWSAWFTASRSMTPKKVLAGTFAPCPWRLSCWRLSVS